MTWAIAATNSVLRLPSGALWTGRRRAALAVHILTDSALTGTTYDIDGGQQLAPGV